MLDTAGLRHAYPGNAPIAFPDVALPQGGRALLRGPSGSGKSTWLGIVAGLLTPGAGRVRAGGVEVTALAPRERDAWRAARLGFVPQRLHLSASLDVQRNLALPYLAAGERPDEARIASLLQRLGLAGLARRRPQALSVGQMQRVAIARAVLRRPALLLADEPTASLDDAAAAVVVRLLDEVAREAGATLVIATHDARVVAALPGAAVIGLAPADRGADHTAEAS